MFGIVEIYRHTVLILVPLASVSLSFRKAVVFCVTAFFAVQINIQMIT